MSMAKKTGVEINKGLMILKLFIEKLQKGFLLPQSRRPDFNAIRFGEEAEAKTMVPDDVKEGHFAVFAVKGGEPKRFLVALGYLANPAFLGLLAQAEEEYGFNQKGALAVPCRPEDLQKILLTGAVKSANARQ